MTEQGFHSFAEGLKAAARKLPATGAVEMLHSPDAALVITSAAGYGSTALKRVAADFARTGASNQSEGAGRNSALNNAALELGHLVGGGLLAEHEVVTALLEGCEVNGLLGWTGRAACEATIASGLAAGIRSPTRWTLAASAVKGVSTDPFGNAYIGTPGVPAAPGSPQGADVVTGELVERPPRPLPGLDLSLLSERCPDPVFIVAGRMTRESLTVLGSKPGVGKSWLAAALSIAVATGGEWLGHQAALGRVLYIDVENGSMLVRRRLQQLGATAEALGGRLHYVTTAIVLPGGEDSRRLHDTIAAFKPDLVIIDTLASVAPSAERDTESMSLFLSDVWHHSREAGAAVLVLAHLRKSMQGAGKDDPLDSFRGAGHLVGAASRAWLLDPRGSDRFALRDVKAREFPACPTVLVRLEDEDLVDGLTDVRTSLVNEGIDDTEGLPLGMEERFNAAVLEYLGQPGVISASTKILHSLAPDEIAKGSISNLLTILVGKPNNPGPIERVRIGHYRLRVMGQEAIFMPSAHPDPFDTAEDF